MPSVIVIVMHAMPMLYDKVQVRRAKVRKCGVWKIGIASLSVSARAVVAKTPRLNMVRTRYALSLREYPSGGV